MGVPAAKADELATTLGRMAKLEEQGRRIDRIEREVGAAGRIVGEGKTVEGLGLDAAERMAAKKAAGTAAGKAKSTGSASAGDASARKLTPPEWASLEPNATRTAKESVGNLERSMRNNNIQQPSPDHVGHHVIPGTVYRDVPMLREIGFRVDHYPNGFWADPAFHPGRHPAYTSAMKKILSEIPMPVDAVSRAAAAKRVGKVMDGAKSVLSGRKPPLRFRDAKALDPRLTHAEFTAQWEAAIRAASK